ncbi:MAG: hypothetical protein ACNI3C_04980 [Candidatus Marinarcus sp.]|uniref:hypothetical protein n=1 Tax=Candidatus Marinarcus sp. TaxID=3100987 RepID=UPI003AFFA560
MKRQKSKLFFLIFIFPLFLLGSDFDTALTSYKKGDYPMALYMFDKSCKNGNKQGCYNLAVMYKQGQGINPCNQKAQEYFSIACEQDAKECRFSRLNNKG